MRDENKIHEIYEVICECYKQGETLEDPDWYIDTKEAAEMVYDWIMKNMSQKNTVKEFKDRVLDYADNHDICAYDIQKIFDEMYPPEKPKLPKFRVEYYSYREGLEGEYDCVVEAESVEDAINEVKDRCYRNYATCEIRGVNII